MLIDSDRPKSLCYYVQVQWAKCPDLTPAEDLVSVPFMPVETAILKHKPSKQQGHPLSPSQKQRAPKTSPKKRKHAATMPAEPLGRQQETGGSTSEGLRSAGETNQQALANASRMVCSLRDGLVSLHVVVGDGVYAID